MKRLTGKVRIGNSQDYHPNIIYDEHDNQLCEVPGLPVNATVEKARESTGHEELDAERKEAFAKADRIVRAWNCFDRFLVAAKALLAMTEFELERCETMTETALLAQGACDLEALIAEAEGGGDEKQKTENLSAL